MLHYLVSIQCYIRHGVCAVSLLLFSCATVPDDRLNRGLFTIAVFGDAVYAGQAFPLGDRGSFRLEEFGDGDGFCTGTYVYQEYPRGRASFECSNGFAGSVRLQGDEALSGRGRGVHDGTRIEVVYGYGLEQTNSMLDLPGGREIRVSGDELILSTP